MSDIVHSDPVEGHTAKALDQALSDVREGVDDAKPGRSGNTIGDLHDSPRIYTSNDRNFVQHARVALHQGAGGRLPHGDHEDGRRAGAEDHLLRRREDYAERVARPE